MKSYQQWMDEYGVDHTHPINQTIHKICVPLIMFSILGILWSLPRLTIVAIELNWAFVLIGLALLFYIALKNIPMLLMMVFQSGIILLLCSWLATKSLLLEISIIIFVLAWLGQFIGHKIEGKKPSFLQDLAFLLIGPLWVNRFLFEKLGMKV